MLGVGELAPSQRSNVQRILNGGYHVLELINEMVDMAHLETSEIATSLEPVRIKEALRNALDAMSALIAERNQRVIANLESCEDCHVRADRRILSQALFSLFSSVIRSCRTGGSLSISCREISGNRLRIEICAQGARAQDYSRGLLTPAQLLTVDVATLHDSELKLSLAQTRINAMRGSIAMEENADGGAQLIVELFLLDDPLERLEGDGAAMLELAHGDRAPQHGTVLYFEDNLPNLALMEDILAFRPGIKLLKALSGRSGLILAEIHAPDWILLDLGLPDMPGEMVVRSLRGNGRTGRIPITILSGDTDPETIRRLIAAGARDYLTKPLDLQKLLSLLDRTITVQN